jgi:hypothetical protein
MDDILKVINNLIQVGKDEGLKVVPEILLVISCTLLFFSPACLFFMLYKGSFYINIECTIILILLLSGMLFLVFYFLASIIVPFSYLVGRWRTKNFQEIDIKNSKVYTFLITMFIFLILSAILIIGYLVIKFNEFSRINQYGIKITLISIITIGGVLAILWGAIGLTKIIAQIKTKINNKKAEEIESERDKDFGEMPDI